MGARRRALGALCALGLAWLGAGCGRGFMTLEIDATALPAGARDAITTVDIVVAHAGGTATGSYAIGTELEDGLTQVAVRLGRARGDATFTVTAVDAAGARVASGESTAPLEEGTLVVVALLAGAATDAGPSDAGPGTDGGGPGSDAGTDAGTDAAGTDAGTDAAPPATDAGPCATPVSIACGDVVADNNGAPGSGTVNTSYPCVGAALSGPERAYAFAPATDAVVYFELTGETADVDPIVLDGAACDKSSCIAANDGTFPTADNAVFFDANGGSTYNLLVDGYMGAVTDYTARVICSPVLAGAGSCADPYVVPMAGPTTVAYEVDGCTAGADLVPPAGVGDCGGAAAGGDAVYRIDLGFDAMLTIDLWDVDSGAVVDVRLYVQTTCGSALPANTLDCSDDYMGELRHGHLELALPTGTYFVVADMGASCGRAALIVEAL